MAAMSEDCTTAPQHLQLTVLNPQNTENIPFSKTSDVVTVAIDEKNNSSAKKIIKPGILSFYSFLHLLIEEMYLELA